MVMVSPTLYCGLESAVTLEGGGKEQNSSRTCIPSFLDPLLKLKMFKLSQTLYLY